MTETTLAGTRVEKEAEKKKSKTQHCGSVAGLKHSGNI